MSSASERAIVPLIVGRGGPCTIPRDAEASLEILSNGFWVVVDTVLGGPRSAVRLAGRGPRLDGVISAPTILRCIKPSPWIESVEVIQTDG